MRLSRRATVAVIVSLAVAVVVGGTIAGNAQTPPPSLTPLSAEQLLSNLITTAETTPPPSLSGEASSSVNLGFPQIPAGVGGTAGTGLTDLLTGDQSYKVWRSTDGVRIANLLPAGERDLVANRTDAWFWDSRTQTAKHMTYDATAMETGPEAQQQTGARRARSTLAATIVRRVAPSAGLSVSSTQWVAGEPTYTLVLTP